MQQEVVIPYRRFGAQNVSKELPSYSPEEPYFHLLLRGSLKQHAINVCF